MKIQVWKRYEENRADKPIEEGIYEQSDPKLFGLARYLIDNGNAFEYVEPIVQAPEEIEPDWPRIEDEARELTVENDKIRKANVKPKRTRKAKS
ncbi:MAG TPA: hypothetical protein ENI05_01150 [Porticoccus sp.]|nr:hypothetical protein [Porticoccus sp.]